MKAGAVDFLPKPFKRDELLVRSRSPRIATGSCCEVPQNDRPPTT